MPFKTQRLANKFPVWTKIRRDPSSLGQRFLSGFADYLDFETSETIKFREEFRLLKRQVGLPSLWTIRLADEFITRTTTKGGGITYNYPITVTADHPTLGATVLSRDEYLEELLFGVPDRIVVKDTRSYTTLTVWDSSTPGTFNTIDNPERLWIDITNSTKYSNVLLEPSFSGTHHIRLEGYDEHFNDLEEILRIRDDGVYITRNVFRELTNVFYEGFDGGIIVKAGGVTLSYEEDPFRLAVMEDLEGPLKMTVEVKDVGGTDYSILRYFTDRLKRGRDYRDGVSSVMTNDETMSHQVLLDSGGMAIEIVDFAVSPDDTRLYAIDNAGFLHVFEHGPSEFSPPAEASSRETFITARVVAPRIEFGVTTKVFTWLQRPHKRIAKVQIKRITPSLTTEYLQANLTWSGTPHFFPGDPTQGLAPATWDDKSFEVTFDETGQWDFYITTVVGEQPFETKDNTSVSHTATLVDSVNALVSIDTGVASPTGLFFGKEGNPIIVDATNLYLLDLKKDSYFADVERQQLLTREQYNSVDVEF